MHTLNAHPLRDEERALVSVRRGRTSSPEPAPAQSALHSHQWSRLAQEAGGGSPGGLPARANKQTPPGATTTTLGVRARSSEQRRRTEAAKGVKGMSQRVFSFRLLGTAPGVCRQGAELFMGIDKANIRPVALRRPLADRDREVAGTSNSGGGESAPRESARAGARGSFKGAKEYAKVLTHSLG